MDRPPMPRPRRTMFRMLVSGLPETSWQVSSPQPISLGFPGFSVSVVSSSWVDPWPVDFLGLSISLQNWLMKTTSWIGNPAAG